MVVSDVDYFGVVFVQGEQVVDYVGVCLWLVDVVVQFLVVDDVVYQVDVIGVVVFEECCQVFGLVILCFQVDI